ncbi:MAG: hypothetical protein IPK78_13845 [Rhodospirillales bacterium]|nr:hypothetical protein [Rhodospirillales bacterium]
MIPFAWLVRTPKKPAPGNGINGQWSEAVIDPEEMARDYRDNPLAAASTTGT